MSKKKLSLDAITNLKSSASLTEQGIIIKEKEDMGEGVEYHLKSLRYPKEWHYLLKDAKKNGKTSLNEAAYILEALRARLTHDGIL